MSSVKEECYKEGRRLGGKGGRERERRKRRTRGGRKRRERGIKVGTVKESVRES